MCSCPWPSLWPRLTSGEAAPASLPKPFNRLTGYNGFWYSHHLFVIVYALLLVHGNFFYLTKKWAFRSSIRAVKIQKVAVYPGNVLTLHVSKPQGFRAMNRSMSSVCNNYAGLSATDRREERAAEGGLRRLHLPRVLIERTYGTPGQDYKKYKVVLLVGLGICATPFISIVEDIVNNMKELDSL
ncbi:hypothetical protein ZIOFF_010618 [Zingiber officinale]|uniref:Uncharacterized protein n=1 Tax=Zingiber officinale TaxID=94328 RepID=A0A8J5HPQ6_ZINOF|nr:hypothetical protein ZIOFF_010618 [Zingiber officinale]